MLRGGGWWACVAVLGLVGCAHKAAVEETPKAPAESRLEKVGAAYQRASYRLNRAPQSADELKPDLDGDPADLFRSPDDGEPFVILWGVDFVRLPPGGKDPFTVAGYERRGADGKRYVLRFPLGVVRMTDEELRKAVFPPGHGPP